MLLSPCVKQFINAKRAGGVRESTLENYQRQLTHFADYLSQQGVVDLEAVTHVPLRDYIAERLAIGQKTLTARSVQGVILTFFRWCEWEEYPIDRRILRRTEKVRVDQDEPRFFTVEECLRFMQAAESMPYRSVQTRRRNVSLLRLMLDTGLRCGEVTALKAEDVDLEHRWVTVRIAKNRKTRRARFGLETAKALSDYLAVRGCRPRWRGDIAPKQVTDDAFFIGWYGEHISNGLVLQIVTRVAAAAGLQGVHPHTLRHSACSMLIRNGLPLAFVQRQMGHSDIRMTMRYSHLIGDDLAEAFDLASPMDNLTSGQTAKAA